MMCLQVDGLEHPAGRRRIFFQKGFRANRTRLKIASAIGADTLKRTYHTIPAKGTLEGADHGLLRVRWKRAIAVFASGTNFQHGSGFVIRQLGAVFQTLLDHRKHVITFRSYQG